MLPRILFCLYGIFHLSWLQAQTAEARVDSLFALADATDSIENSIAYLLSAVSLSEDCLPCKARCHAELGKLYCQNGNYEAGYLYLETAIKLRRKQGDSLRVAGNYSNIALYKLEEGRQAQALKNGFVALRILEELQRDRNQPSIKDTLTAKSLAIAYNLLSNIQNDFGNHLEGLQYALKSKALYQTIDASLAELFDADYTLAGRYFTQHQNTRKTIFADSATLLYQHCLEIFEENPAEFLLNDVADIHHNLASLAISMQAFETSWKEINLAEPIYKQVNDAAGIIDIAILKANTYIGQDRNYRKALSTMQQAQLLLQQSEIDTSVMLEMYKLLSECFEALDQPDSALTYSRLAEQLYTKLFTSQQKRFNEIDRENLEKRNELQQSLSKLEIDKSHERQRLWASLAAILGLLAAVGALIWRQREQRQNLKIANQNQAIEDTLKDAQLRFLQGIIEGQQLEREETKHVLHNDIANTVLSLSYEIENAKPQHPQQKGWSGELRNLAAHTRRLSHQKGGIIQEVGLYESINDLLRRISQPNLIEVEFITNLNSKRLGITTEIEIWHMVQEMVSNTLKYARASRIELAIDTDNRAVFITYHDDGTGFDYDSTFAEKKSLGLNSIIEKTQNLGGNTPEIMTSPGHGFTISIEIPLQKPELP